MFRIACASATAAFGNACATGDLVVFEGAGGATAASADVASSSGNTSSGSDAGGAPPLPIDCTHQGDCPASWFCSKPACGATLGHCEPAPVFCDAEPDPVCGCDGIAFWNDCVRRQYGASASTKGECQATAKLCFKGADCGFPTAHCARLLFPGQPCPGPDMPPEQGTCWALPPNCTDANNPERWAACPRPEMPPRPMCSNTCQAITSELPHMAGAADCGPP